MNVVEILRNLRGDKVGAVIEELHRSESDLAAALLRLSDRHKADHEVFHVARDVARWSQEHVRRLAYAGREYDLELDPEPVADDEGLLARVRQKGSELTGRRHEPAVLLLADLRHLHQQAAGVSLDWELLAQAAEAVKDEDLLALASRCHAQTLRQVRWANAQVKELAAQIIVTG
jgi:hypothetical protein